MHANNITVLKRIPAYAVLALLALAAAALVFSSAPPVHGQGENPPTPTVTFSPGTISAKLYTAGAAVPKEPPVTDAQLDVLRLPEATLNNAPANTVGWDAAYGATDLLAGLTMGDDRIIRGTPTTPTNAVTVTYTATVTAYVDPDADGVYDDLTESTYTKSLTFQVSVAPPVTFNEEAMTFINSQIIAWQSGQGWVPRGSDDKVAFPAASGGAGTLTYSLLENSSGDPLSSVASGITFDTGARKLGGTPAAAARDTWAVTYVATDQNGGAAKGYLAIYAGGYGGL